MSAATAKAPTLAWLLTALTCLLVGMAIVESRHQVVALPAAASLGVVEPVESAAASPPTPAPSPTPTALIADILVPPSAGPATLRVDRLTIPPGVGLPSEVAAGTTVLLVEAGPLTVRVDGAR